jgi:hypothetical protein
MVFGGILPRIIEEEGRDKEAANILVSYCQ